MERLSEHPFGTTKTAFGNFATFLWFWSVCDLFALQVSRVRSYPEHENADLCGKADPADPASKTVIEQGDRLWNRLNEHRKNIEKAITTLESKDFEYRALVVQTGYQTAAEDYLIELFKPIWNSETGVCFGFGKHGDAPETRSNQRLPWDTLHPGRDWAHRDQSMPDARSIVQIRSDIALHLQKNPPFESIDDILRQFMDEMRSAT